MLNIVRSIPISRILIVMAVWACASTALAGNVAAASQGMPWDSPLTSFRGSFTGVVGPCLILVGIVMTCGSVILQGELQEFGRRGPAMMIGGAGVMGANALLRMFSSGGLLL